MCCSDVLYFSECKSFLLYFSTCGLLCDTFPHMEHALILWNFVLYFPMCGLRSSIAEFCVLFFHVWIAIWYCKILSYIFLRVDCALVLCNSVLYISRIWNKLYYCVISCYISCTFHFILCCIIPTLLLFDFFPTSLILHSLDFFFS